MQPRHATIPEKKIIAGYLAREYNADAASRITSLHDAAQDPCRPSEELDAQPLLPAGRSFWRKEPYCINHRRQYAVVTPAGSIALITSSPRKAAQKCFRLNNPQIRG